MRLMCLPHHFPHCSRRTLSPSGVKCCKHATGGVIAFFIYFFLIYMHHSVCHCWSESMSPSCSSKSKVTDSLLKYVRSTRRLLKYVYSAPNPSENLANLYPTPYFGCTPCCSQLAAAPEEAGRCCEGAVSPAAGGVASSATDWSSSPLRGWGGETSHCYAMKLISRVFIYTVWSSSRIQL